MSDFINAQTLEETYGVTLPERYLRFLANEVGTRSGWLANLGTYRDPMPVYFDSDALESFVNDDWPEDDQEYGHISATEIEWSSHPGCVPFATIGDEEAPFLVCCITEAACPVLIWEPDDGSLTPIADSLDDFLAGLTEEG